MTQSFGCFWGAQNKVIKLVKNAFEMVLRLFKGILKEATYNWYE